MLIMIRVLLSWITHDPYNQFIRILYVLTDLILKPLQQILPLQSAGIDFSPMVAFVIIGFIKNLVLSVI